MGSSESISLGLENDLRRGTLPPDMGAGEACGFTGE